MTLLKVTAALGILMVLSACGQTGGNPDGTPEGPDRPVVALIMKSLANEFFVAMADGARDHQAENAERYELIVNGIKNETDLAQQVALIDQMIASRVEAMVIAPADSRAVVPAIARAIEAGIIVVNIDNKLDGDVLSEYGLEVPFVGPDNFLGAEAVGQYLASQLDEASSVAILEGVPTAFNSQQRTAGFRKAMEDAGIDIVAQQSAQWDQTIAITIASGILVQHSNLDAILAANDNMALGAVAAITQSGRAGEVAVVGFDNISAIRQLIRDGQVLASADQHGDLLAVYGIEAALQVLETGASLEDRATPVDLITIDNVE